MGLSCRVMEVGEGGLEHLIEDVRIGWSRVPWLSVVCLPAGRCHKAFATRGGSLFRCAGLFPILQSLGLRLSSLEQRELVFQLHSWCLPCGRGRTDGWTHGWMSFAGRTGCPSAPLRCLSGKPLDLQFNLWMLRIQLKENLGRGTKFFPAVIF